MTGCPGCGRPLDPDAQTCPNCQADNGLWIARAGSVYGPYTLRDLEQARSEDRLGQDDQISVGGSGQWLPLSEFLHGTATPGKAAPPLPPVVTTVPRPSGSSLPVLVVVLVAFFAVVAMLAIVAAIAFPVFAKSREKARQASCLSNLKQISLGLMIYAQDYNEHFPPASQTPEVARLEDGRVTTAMDFPVDTYYAPDSWRTRIYPYLRNRQIFVCPSTQSAYSYQLNDRLYRRSLGEVRRPAETSAAYETGLYGGAAKPPHNGGFNVGYVDGHCRWLSSGLVPNQDP